MTNTLSIIKNIDQNIKVKLWYNSVLISFRETENYIKKITNKEIK